MKHPENDYGGSRSDENPQKAVEPEAAEQTRTDNSRQSDSSGSERPAQGFCDWRAILGVGEPTPSYATDEAKWERYWRRQFGDATDRQGRPAYSAEQIRKIARANAWADRMSA